MIISASFVVSSSVIRRLGGDSMRLLGFVDVQCYVKGWHPCNNFRRRVLWSVRFELRPCLLDVIQQVEYCNSTVIRTVYHEQNAHHNLLCFFKPAS